MKLKICGIRTNEGLNKVDGFCDFIGLNFSKYSKRSIKIGDLVDQSNVLKKSKIVGVFYKNEISEILKAVKIYDFFSIQIYDDFDYEGVNEIKNVFNGEIWLAKNTEKFDFKSENFKKICEKIDMILFDGKIFGSGVENDIEKVKIALKNVQKQFGVAGGINVDNILKFIKNFSNAKLLDLASGVETNGLLDEKKIVEISKIFYQNAK